MTKATTEALQELHGVVAKSLKQRIDQDMEDNIPTDAATLGAAIKFLKDNNISADPADKDSLESIRTSMVEASKKRKERAANVLEFAKNDLKQAGG